MAMTEKKRKFLRRLKREIDSRPPTIFEWNIVSEKGKILATIQAPYGAYALHSFWLSEKGRKYKGAVTAVPKNENNKKGGKK